ncbi:DUF3530 family protein [Alteromonas gilva]|uniref:DUF3530 family protein n=1 Tax=Alteromonas gilva TaxID=2987522 RepID=A0ABT5L7Q2_9ALTE|nr:DUF3530 family protein [Alteromonas gilva]MDC8833080.1 DUF3530 family protein [Alteromonas gilva]
MSRIITTVIVSLWLAVPAVCANTMDDLSRYFQDDELRSLAVADQQIPALEVEPSVPMVRGIAIVLVSTQSPSLNLDTGLVLADTLKQKGWRTLLVPTDFTQALATQSTVTDNPKPVANLLNSPIDYDSYRLQIIGLVNAAYQYASQYKGYTFIVAEGMTSAVLLDALHNNLLSAPDTLVSIGAFWPARQQNQALVDWLAQSTYPLLDISIPTLSHWQTATVQSRKEAAAVSLKPHYRQRMFTTNQYYGGASTRIPGTGSVWLGQEIYSWVRYLGW